MSENSSNNGADEANQFQMLLMRFFEPQDVSTVSDLIYCTMNELSLYRGNHARIWFAIIKVSGGNIDTLFYALDLAKMDWRDLLVAADFANDIEAHQKWAAKILAEN